MGDDRPIAGEAARKVTQGVVTGAGGTPPIWSPVTCGISVYEQNGLNAPAAVASSMESFDLDAKARRTAPSSLKARKST